MQNIVNNASRKSTLVDAVSQMLAGLSHTVSTERCSRHLNVMCAPQVRRTTVCTASHRNRSRSVLHRHLNRRERPIDPSHKVRQWHAALTIGELLETEHLSVVHHPDRARAWLERMLRGLAGRLTPQLEQHI